SQKPVPPARAGRSRLHSTKDEYTKVHCPPRNPRSCSGSRLQSEHARGEVRSASAYFANGRIGRICERPTHHGAVVALSRRFPRSGLLQSIQKRIERSQRSL